jgi:hypothetical protein
VEPELDDGRNRRARQEVPWSKGRGPGRANGQSEEAVLSLKEGGTTGGSEVAGIH